MRDNENDLLNRLSDLFFDANDAIGRIAHSTGQERLNNITTAQTKLRAVDIMLNRLSKIKD